MQSAGVNSPRQDQQENWAINRNVNSNNLLTVIGLPERNPLFVGREMTLNRLREQLANQGQAVLAGQSGVGKSQLAKHFTHQALTAGQYSLVIWLPAESMAGLVTACQAVAKQLGLDIQALKGEEAIVAVKDYLENTETRWLLIFDNVENKQWIKLYQPKFGGDTLITSRHPESWPNAIQVTPFTQAEALQLVQTVLNNELASHRIVAADCEAMLATVTKGNTYHPLTVALASFYLREQLRLGNTLNECLQSLEHWDQWSQRSEQWQDLLDYENKLTSFHLPMVQGLKALAEHPSELQAAAKLALHILDYCAYLYPDDIPEWFIQSVLNVQETDKVWQHARALLASYDLVEVRGEQTSDQARHFTLHRLVQAALRLSLPEAKRQEQFATILSYLNQQFNWSRVGYDKRLDPVKDHIYATQAEALLKIGAHNQLFEANVAAVAKLYNSLGRFYFVQDLLPQAQSYYQQAKEVLEQYDEEVKKNPWYYAEVLHNVGGVILRDWERYSPQEQRAAVDALQEAYKGQMSIYQSGDTTYLNHPITREQYRAALYTRRMLGRALKKQGNYQEAKKLFHELLNQYLLLEQEVRGVERESVKALIALTYMDLGVVANLEQDNKLQRDYSLAIGSLEESARRYHELDSSKYKTKDKDLAVALIRLGEAYFAAYLANSDTDSPPAKKSWESARSRFLEASGYNQGKYAISEARLKFRLAQVEHVRNHLNTAAAYAKEVLVLQQKLYPADHPYVQATQTLLADLSNKLTPSSPQRARITLSNNPQGFYSPPQSLEPSHPEHTKREQFKEKLISAMAARIINYYQGIAEGNSQLKDKVELLGKMVQAAFEIVPQQAGFAGATLEIGVGKALQQTVQILLEQHAEKKKQQAARLVNLTLKAGQIEVTTFLAFAHRLSLDYQEQLKKLTPASVDKLASYAAEKILNYLGAQHTDPTLPLIYHLRQGLLLGVGKGNSQLQLADSGVGKTWDARELLEGIGFRTETGQYYTLRNKEEDFCDKYGFAILENPSVLGNRLGYYDQYPSEAAALAAKDEFIQTQKKRCVLM